MRGMAKAPLHEHRVESARYEQRRRRRMHNTPRSRCKVDGALSAMQRIKSDLKTSIYPAQ